MTTITAQTNFVLTLDERNALDAHWRTIHKTASAPQLLILALLRGRNPAKGFTPITRPTKLARGNAWRGAVKAQAEAGAYARILIMELIPSVSAARAADLKSAIAGGIQFAFGEV